MQAGDAHQMADAGAGEELPVAAVNGALIADREGDDHAGVGCAVEGDEQALANSFARAIHESAGRPDKRRQQHVACFRAALACSGPHIAGRADSAFEQKRLVVEHAGVCVAMRFLQPHRQTPALARMHRSHRIDFAGAEAAIPGKLQALWHNGLRGEDGFGAELETHTALERLWQ